MGYCRVKMAPSSSTNEGEVPKAAGFEPMSWRWWISHDSFTLHLPTPRVSLSTISTRRKLQNTIFVLLSPPFMTQHFNLATVLLFTIFTSVAQGAKHSTQPNRLGTEQIRYTLSALWLAELVPVKRSVVDTVVGTACEVIYEVVKPNEYFLDHKPTTEQHDNWQLTKNIYTL